MLFGHTDEFYRDESGNILGPTVRVIYTLRDGDIVIEHIPAALASALVMYDDVLNGTLYVSARIDYGNLLDIWGGSM